MKKIIAIFGLTLFTLTACNENKTETKTKTMATATTDKLAFDSGYSEVNGLKMYYEILVFGQNNGLQQITIMHREDDKYGKQMLERILNSVELQNISQP